MKHFIKYVGIEVKTTGVAPKLFGEPIETIAQQTNYLEKNAIYGDRQNLVYEMDKIFEENPDAFIDKFNKLTNSSKDGRDSKSKLQMGQFMANFTKKQSLIEEFTKKTTKNKERPNIKSPGNVFNTFFNFKFGTAKNHNRKAKEPQRVASPYPILNSPENDSFFKVIANGFSNGMTIHEIKNSFNESLQKYAQGCF